MLNKEGYLLGCPSSCKCEEFGKDSNKEILVTGEDLLTVPRKLPFNTGAVYVTRNYVEIETRNLLLLALFVFLPARS